MLVSNSTLCTVPIILVTIYIYNVTKEVCAYERAQIKAEIQYKNQP